MQCPSCNGSLAEIEDGSRSLCCRRCGHLERVPNARNSLTDRRNLAHVRELKAMLAAKAEGREPAPRRLVG